MDSLTIFGVLFSFFAVIDNAVIIFYINLFGDTCDCFLRVNSQKQNCLLKHMRIFRTFDVCYLVFSKKCLYILARCVSSFSKQLLILTFMDFVFLEITSLSSHSNRKHQKLLPQRAFPDSLDRLVPPSSFCFITLITLMIILMPVLPTVFKPSEGRGHVYISCSPQCPQCLSQCPACGRFSIRV